MIIKSFLLLTIICLSSATIEFLSLPKCSPHTCGGIAGLICCPGLSCRMNGSYPDAIGICVPALTPECENKSCGGIGGLTCCEGYYCMISNPRNISDPMGRCMKLGQGCMESGEICGGYAGAICCSGDCNYRPGADYGYCS